MSDGFKPLAMTVSRVEMDITFADIARALIRPGIFLLFGLVFLWAWNIDRKRAWLLYIAAACTTLCFAILAHFFLFQGRSAPKAIASSVLYTIAVLAACEGLLLRAGKQLGWRPMAAMLVSMMALLWYFAYPAPSLWARIYVQNFGYGALILFTSFRLAGLRHGSLPDRVLFWILLGFSVQLFLQTVLTIGFLTPEGGVAFMATPFWNSLQFSLTIFGAALAFAVLIAAVADMMADLRGERDLDPLTGLLNRRGLEERLRYSARQLQKVPVSIIVCDLDHFKSVNDTFGHAAGDQVLKAFGGLLKSSIGQQDIAARTGGEEFSVLLEGLNEENAAEIADRIRQRLESLPLEFEAGTRLVTASFGVAQQRAGEPFSVTLKRADERLYKAKRAGRNRVVSDDRNLMSAQSQDTPVSAA